MTAMPRRGRECAQPKRRTTAAVYELTDLNPSLVGEDRQTDVHPVASNIDP